MATSTLRYVATTTGSSTTDPTVDLDITTHQPNDGDYLLALWLDSSEGATTIAAAESGWEYGGSIKSGEGGVSGSRRSQVAWATRTWNTGDSLTVTPFHPAAHNNFECRVFVFTGAGFTAGALTSHAEEVPAVTGSLSFAASGDFFLLGGYAFPRSTVSEDTLLPNPPFTASPALIGTGFDNLFGYYSSGAGSDSAFGPYDASDGTESSVAFLLAVALAEPVAVVRAADDRLRSSISETTGSLLDAVDVRAVDASVSEAYTYAQALEPAVLTSFREVTRERDSETVDLAYYPRPKQSLQMENVYDGVTILSRLARYFPPREFDTVDATGLDIVVSGDATAQEVITYLLTQWAADTGWLTFEPVPDLRLPLPGLTPADYTEDSTGRVATEALAIAQDGTNRRSALDILQDFLSPFPGTVLRQNSTGKLEIVPIYGPDADEDPHKVLTEWDVYAISVGRPDPFSIVNRATVTNTSYERQEDTPIMQPAWFQIGSPIQYGFANWFEPPNDRVNLQPFVGDFTALQEFLLFDGPFDLQAPGLWPVSPSVIAAGAGVSLLDSDDAPLVTHAWARYFGTSLVDSGNEAGNLTIVTPVIPFSGERVTAFTFARSIGGGLSAEPVQLTVFARWNETRQGIEFTFGDRNLETDRTTGANGIIIEFTLNDASTAFAETGGRTGTFGFVEDVSDPSDIKEEDDALPGIDGVNAVAESQAEYGIIEAQLNLRGYSLSTSTLAEIARAYVLANITPRVTREVDLSLAGSSFLVFDDMGRLVELSNGDVGYLTGRTYSDDFTARSWRATATVEVRDLAAPGAIDTTTDYLLNDDGTYFQNDDNTFSEVF